MVSRLVVIPPTYGIDVKVKSHHGSVHVLAVYTSYSKHVPPRLARHTVHRALAVQNVDVRQKVGSDRDFLHRQSIGCVFVLFTPPRPAGLCLQASG